MQHSWCGSFVLQQFAGTNGFYRNQRQDWCFKKSMDSNSYKLFLFYFIPTKNYDSQNVGDYGSPRVLFNKTKLVVFHLQ